MSTSSVNISPLFSFKRFPELLASQADLAKRGLEEEPKSFQPLDSLVKFLQLAPCDFTHFYPQANKILIGETFQDLPGPLGRLTPLAESYIQALESVEAALGATPVQVVALKAALGTLIIAHREFEELYTIESQNAAPAEPFTVLSRYPNALRLYFAAFVDQLAKISPERYDSWKNYASSSGEEVLELFPRLAIHHLLKNPSAILPELFSDQAETIANLRESYEALTESQREELLETLRFERDAEDESVQALFVQIGAVCSHLQTTDGRVFNGVARIVYEEAAKAFSLLDGIDLSEWPRNVEIQFRAVFLAILKQDAFIADQLPRDLSGDRIEEETVSMHGKYQTLTDEEKERFDALFLAGEKQAKEKPIHSLLRNWDAVYCLWAARRPIFPIHLLAKVAFQRQHTFVVQKQKAELLEPL